MSDVHRSQSHYFNVWHKELHPALGFMQLTHDVSSLKGEQNYSR